MHVTSKAWKLEYQSGIGHTITNRKTGELRLIRGGSHAPNPQGGDEASFDRLMSRAFATKTFKQESPI